MHFFKARHCTWKEPGKEVFGEGGADVAVSTIPCPKALAGPRRGAASSCGDVSRDQEARGLFDSLMNLLF